jgi:hypothetical protein
MAKVLRENAPNSLEQALTWNSYLKTSEYKERRLTWGKYINKKIVDLPDDYLVWALFNHGNLQWRDYLTREFRSRYPDLVKHLLKELTR